MNNHWKIKMDQATEAAGGGGSGSLITPSAGGGSQATAGNGSAVAASSGGVAATGSNSATAGAAGSTASDWRSTLSKELQEDASVKKFSDVSTLAQSYVNLQKQLGKDKITVPGAATSEEEWKDIYSKLGLPADVDKYEVRFKEGVSLDKKFVDDFRSNAHKAGILPGQAQKLADWFSQVNTQSESEVALEMKKNFETEQSKLKAEWGEAYQQKASRVNALVQKFGNEDVIKKLTATGALGSSDVVKFLAAVADTLFKEGKIIEGATGESGVMTPAEADKEWKKILGDKAHPYNVPDHPLHKQSVNEVQQLVKQVFPGS